MAPGASSGHSPAGAEEKGINPLHSSSRRAEVPPSGARREFELRCFRIFKEAAEEESEAQGPKSRPYAGSGSFTIRRCPRQ